METRTKLFIFLLAAALFAPSALGAAHSSKADVTAVIDEVAQWYAERGYFDYPTLRQFMIELGNVESDLGMAPGAYSLGSKVGLGWAQFVRGRRVAFVDVINYMNANPAHAEAVKQRWGFDPRSVKVEELADYGADGKLADTKSAVFCAEYLRIMMSYSKAKLPGHDIKTLSGRARLWKDVYNSELGSGSASGYESKNTKLEGGIKKLYIGTDATGDKYTPLSEEEQYLAGQQVQTSYVDASAPPGVTYTPPPAPAIPSPLSRPQLTVTEDTWAQGEPDVFPEAHSSKSFVTAIIENVARWYNNEWGEKYEVAYQAMVEVGNAATGLGTDEDAYEGYDEGHGWANIDQYILDSVNESLSGYPDILASIKEKWGFDPTNVTLEELDGVSTDADTRSAVILREYLFGPDMLPETIDERAEVWADNFLEGAGGASEDATEEYLEANTFEDKNDLMWAYAGTMDIESKTGDVYFAKDDEMLYFLGDEMTRGVFLDEGATELEVYTCMSKGKGRDDWKRFRGGCLWITDCDGDTEYSHNAASGIRDYFIGTKQYERGDFSIAWTPVGDEPAGYINNKLGQVDSSVCGRKAVINTWYAGCENALEAAPLLSTEAQATEAGLCSVDSGDYSRMAEYIFSGEDTERGGPLSSIWKFFRKKGDTMSVYMTRVYADFIRSGKAYQFLPAGLVLNNTLNVTITHEGREFSHGDGVFVYRYEDVEIQEDCEMRVLGETSKAIPAAGGSLGLGDVTLAFSAGAVPDGTVITIKSLELDCKSDEINTTPTNATPPNGSITPNGTIIKTGQGGFDIIALLIVAVASAIAGILAYSQIEARRKK